MNKFNENLQWPIHDKFLDIRNSIIKKTILEKQNEGHQIYTNLDKMTEGLHQFTTALNSAIINRVAKGTLLAWKKHSHIGL